MRGVPNALIQGYMLRRDEIQRKNEKRRKREQELADRKEQWARLDQKTTDEREYEKGVTKETREYEKGLLQEERSREDAKNFREGNIKNQEQIKKQGDAISLYNMMKASGTVPMRELNPGEIPSDSMLAYYANRVAAAEQTQRSKKESTTRDLSWMVKGQINKIASIIKDKSPEQALMEFNDYINSDNYTFVLNDLQDDDKDSYYRLIRETENIKTILETPPAQLDVKKPQHPLSLPYHIDVPIRAVGKILKTPPLPIAPSPMGGVPYDNRNR